jgi:RNA polymerase sigma factor (sigma-70 family)
MASEGEFHGLLLRLRAGDAAAAAELVRTYESDVRRAIRVRMTDARLRRLVDSVDICQSVLTNFFVRAAAGQFDVESPSQLVALLVTMAQNRIHDLARRERASKRDTRRTLAIHDQSTGFAAIPTNDPTASAVASGHELLARVRAHLSPDELRVFERRLAGFGWTEISEQLGTPPNTLRMRYTRAIDRVAGELNLEPSTDV